MDSASHNAFEVLFELQRDYPDRVLGLSRLPEREAVTAEIPSELSPRLKEYLFNAKISRLYSHQAEAIQLVFQNQHVIVVTGTASGKTYCYNLPVLHTLLNEPSQRALYLYPTKALAQDQLGKLRAMEFEAQVPCATYDGDTPADQRASIRRAARIILTNPDMLHRSIMPKHREWIPLFRNLRYVVVDEIHTYRGVFGSHVSHTLRRLLRLARFYGSEPQFICASATVGNPEELAETLTSLPFALVDEDGSPRGEQWFALWQPPLLDAATLERVSPNSETSRLIQELMQRKVRHLTFVRARVTAEVVLRMTQEAIREKAAAKPSMLPLINQIASYRAGYLPQERREIENALFNGRLLSVIATNALELGIDIGELEAVIMNGYPGNIASLWQQMGRAGRKHAGAIAILVMHNDPLHAYFEKHPDQLLFKPIEFANLNPQNPTILSKHLICAALEKPLNLQDLNLFGIREDDSTLSALIEGGLLRKQGGNWVYTRSQSPAPDVNIRSVSGENYRVVDSATGRSVATVEEDRVFQTIHPNAIYLHQGDSYRILELNLQGRMAVGESARVDYYTIPLRNIMVEPLVEIKSRPYGKGEIGWGVVRVIDHVVGFETRQLGSNAVLSRDPLELPPRTFETTAFWWKPLMRTHETFQWLYGQEFTQSAFLDEIVHPLYPGMHALEHLLRAMIPVLTGCDMNDIEGATQPQAIRDAIYTYLYDSMPGGAGLSQAAFERADQLLRMASERLRECACSEGCPACILLSACALRNSVLDKALALRIADELL